MANNNNQGLYNSMNPLSYMGINSSSPSQMILRSWAPTNNDSNFLIGTMWLNTATETPTKADVYMLVAKPQGIARWISFA